MTALRHLAPSPRPSAGAWEGTLVPRLRGANEHTPLTLTGPEAEKKHE